MSAAEGLGSGQPDAACSASNDCDCSIEGRQCHVVLLLSQTIRRDEVHLYNLILPRYEDGCQIVILQRFQQELRLAARAGARDQGSSILCIYASEVIPCFLSI